jgi:RHS repeat-associated protein
MKAKSDTDITTYTYDQRDRLTEVSHYATYSAYSGQQPDQVVQYSYDYQNRLVKWTLDSDGDGTVDSSTVYVYDGSQIALQFDHSGTGSAAASDLSHRYLWGPAVDQLLADEQLSPLPSGEGPGFDLTTPGNVVWPLTDQLGTVRDLAVYNSQTGVTTIANHRVYDSFGNLTSQTNSAVDCVFGFTGRLFDSATGLQNNLNRWYDATTGQWMSEDPMGFGGGDCNLTRYVGNSPTNATDPSGKDIYLKQGNNTGNAANDMFHRQICVDTWRKVYDPVTKEMRWERTGNQSYSFGINESRKHFPQSTKWLGRDIGDATPDGDYDEGEIYVPAHDVGKTIDTHKTTPEQDIKWKKYMDRRVGTKDRYMILLLDCIKFSTDEFKDAPKHY